MNVAAGSGASLVLNTSISLSNFVLIGLLIINKQAAMFESRLYKSAISSPKYYIWSKKALFQPIGEQDDF